MLGDHIRGGFKSTYKALMMFLLTFLLMFLVAGAASHELFQGLLAFRVRTTVRRDPVGKPSLVIPKTQDQRVMHALIVELGGFFGALASLWPAPVSWSPECTMCPFSALLVGGLGTGRCIWPVGVPSDSKTAMGISYVVAQGAAYDTSPQRSRGPPNIPSVFEL
ncbi:hypothetical protein B0H13DRAFT_2674575 [Mycena leptocephala]|nr:hypothetical protein B0H13DRAFT_2674575 [Mycena leptocephala]